MKEILKLNAIHKEYTLGESKVQALRGLNLSLYEGEFSALVGASGSGKSTLLNLIGQLDTPDSGEIIIDGVTTSKMSDDQKSDLRNDRLGFIFQNFNLISVLNVFENVELPLIIQKNISKKEREERVVEALKSVGLEQFIYYMPDKLSGGQRQRVAIARSLVTKPALILADEPTANLDSKTTHTIIDLMLKLNVEKKVTFLFCTHDEKLIGRVKRVVRIQDGIIVEDVKQN